MIAIKTEIPALCFPHELAEIEIDSPADEVRLTVEIDGGTLTLDIYRMEGLGHKVCRFDEALRDMMPWWMDKKDGISSLYTVKLTAEDGNGDSVERTFRLLRCNVNPGMTAEEYVKARFLTMCGADKVTYPNAVEQLYIYSTEFAGEEYSVRCTYVSEADGCSVVREERRGLQPQKVTDGIFRLDVRPSRFTSTDADGNSLRLVAYEVRCGRRVAHYSVRQAAHPVTLLFSNAFGVMDTLHLPQEPDAEVKPTRSVATFSGLTRNYRVVPLVELTGRTGPVGPGMAALVADLCNSTYVTDEEGRALVLLDQDVKPTGDTSALTSCTIKWRYAKERPELLAEVQAKTFEDTFDESFL